MVSFSELVLHSFLMQTSRPTEELKYCAVIFVMFNGGILLPSSEDWLLSSSSWKSQPRSVQFLVAPARVKSVAFSALYLQLPFISLSSISVRNPDCDVALM